MIVPHEHDSEPTDEAGAEVQSSYPKTNKRIAVCQECGCLYDLHYIDKVEIRKNSIMKFECKNCGMVPTVYKNLEDFQSSPTTTKES